MGADGWGYSVSAVVGLLLILGTIVQYLKKKWHAGNYFAIGAYLFYFPVHLWFWQFLLTNRGIPGWYTYSATIQIVTAIGFVTRRCFGQFRPILTAIALSYCFSLILQLFSYIYWANGAGNNFSVTLTHLDSFYLALGTFTTAGTGNIAPLTEAARGFQTLQMGLDFILIGLVVGLVMTRYTNLLDRPGGKSPKETSVLESIAGLAAALNAKALNRAGGARPRDIPPIAPPADWSEAT